MSDLTSIDNWTAEPEEGRDPEDWPYPDAFTVYAVSGDLRRKVLARVGREGGEVRLTEREVSDGYSEYTQENGFFIDVTVDGELVYSSDIGDRSSVAEGREWKVGALSGLGQFLRWMDGG